VSHLPAILGLLEKSVSISIIGTYVDIVAQAVFLFHFELHPVLFETSKWKLDAS
jgi:hypothetical protein